MFLTVAGTGDNDVFYSTVDFRGMRFEDGDSKISLKELSLANALLTGMDIERTKFVNVRWRIHTEKVAWLCNLSRPILDEEQAAIATRRPSEIELVADCYRQLVLNSEKNRRFDLAEQFHLTHLRHHAFGSSAFATSYKQQNGLVTRNS